jgi:hypothetical protein
MAEAAVATPAASVAGGTGGGVTDSGAAPTSELDVSHGGAPSGEGGGHESADPGADGQGGHESGTEADGNLAGDEQQQTSEEDGRAIPAKWRDLFSTDKELRTLFFERRAFMKECPGGLQEVRQLKQSLDLVGGEAGLEAMQTDNADFRKVATAFADGDPAFVDDLAESDPIAFGTQVPHVLDKFQKVDTPGYNREISKRINGEHKLWGLRPRLEQIYADVKATDPKSPALKLLNEIAAWHDKIDEIANAEENPEVKALKDKLKTVARGNDEQTRAKRQGEYEKEVTGKIDVTADKMVDSYIRGKGYDEADIKRIRRAVMKETDEAIAADKEWAKKRDLLHQRHDKDASVRFVHAKWQKELARIVPLVMRTFNRGGKRTTTTTTTAAAGDGAQRPAASGGFKAVEKVPNVKDVDRSQTSVDMMLKEHRAVLKDGSKVDWSRALAG